MIGSAELKLVPVKKVPSICTFCAVGCGLILYVANGRVVRVEGDPYHPINRGSLCPKPLALTQLIHGEHRLKYPMMRTEPRKGHDIDPKWRRISWDEALEIIARKCKIVMEEYVRELKRRGWLTPKPSRREELYAYDGHDHPIAFYGSAQYNNEEAYLQHKLAALLGTNNIDHTARRCHASTVAALAATFGFGAMTNHFIDVANAKRIMIIGGNPASAHPIAFKWIMRALEKGAKLIVVDPRFSRSASKADLYVRIRPGTDAVFFLAIAKFAIDNGYADLDFLRSRTDAPFLLYVDKYPYEPVKIESTADRDWTGRPNPFKGVKTFAVYDRSTGTIRPWVEVPPENRELEWEGEFNGRKVKTVFRVLKEVLEVYTPEEVERVCGISRDLFLKAAKMFCEEKPGTVLYSMGLTQHTDGTFLLRALAIMQLVLGNMGRPGGGINAIRGHSNVQGATDMCVLAHLLPGYIPRPRSPDEIREYQAWKNAGMPSDTQRTVKPIRTFRWKGKVYEKDKEYPNPWYLQTLKIRKFVGWRRFEITWGIFVGTWPLDDCDNGAVICDLPFYIGHPTHELERAFGFNKVKVYFIQGSNNVVTDGGASITYEMFTNYEFKPDKPEESERLLVVIDTWLTETAKLADIVLPAACFAEKEGSVTNSGRWIQWRWKAVDPPGEAKSDLEILILLYKVLRRYGVIKLPSERYIEDHPDEPFPTTPDGKKYLEYIPPETGVPYPDTYPRPDPDRSWNWYVEPSFDPKRTAEKVYAEMDDAVALYDGMYAHEHLGFKYAREAYDAGKGEILAKRRENWLRPGIDSKYMMYKNWCWSWPKNIRVLYFAEDTGEDDSGKPLPPDYWNPWYKLGHTFYYGKSRVGLATIWQNKYAKLIAKLEEQFRKWTGKYLTGRKWRGPSPPGEGTTSGGRLPVGGIPEHGEPVESPVPELHDPDTFSGDYPSFAWLYIKPESEYEGNDKIWKWRLYWKPDKCNAILTTFRLTEHFHTFTRNAPWLNELQPELFIELPEELAREIGVKTGDYVTVESARGKIVCKALVTPRIDKIRICGRDFYIVAMPFHWGYAGLSKGSITNFITMPALDPIAKIHETKCCLVLVRKPTADELRKVLEQGYYIEISENVKKIISRK